MTASRRWASSDHYIKEFVEHSEGRANYMQQDARNSSIKSRHSSISTPESRELQVYIIIFINH